MYADTIELCTFYREKIGTKIEMDLNQFKDYLFDAINESNLLPLRDIQSFDRENRFVLTMWDESEFEIICRQNKKRDCGEEILFFPSR